MAKDQLRDLLWHSNLHPVCGPMPGTLERLGFHVHIEWFKGELAI
jgi:hypothetical protein